MMEVLNPAKSAAMEADNNSETKSNHKTTVTTAETSSLEDSTEDLQQSDRHLTRTTTTRGRKTPTRFHDDGDGAHLLSREEMAMLARCSNPDPVEEENSNSLNAAHASTTTARKTPKLVRPQAVVPKVIRVSAPAHRQAAATLFLHPQLERHHLQYPSHTGGVATRTAMKVDAQVDFPIAHHNNNLSNANSNANGGSLHPRPQHLPYNAAVVTAPRVGPIPQPPSQQVPQHAQQPQYIINRRSPAASQASSSNKNGKHLPSLAGGSIESGSSPSVHPTPFFQRLMSEEVSELKACLRMIEQQNRRLEELQRGHDDLEARLEIQTNHTLRLEQTLEERERHWAQQIAQLEQDRDRLKEVVKTEEVKNEHLMVEISRKKQEIHRMLQRKFTNSTRDVHRDLHRDMPTGGGSSGLVRNGSATAASKQDAPAPPAQSSRKMTKSRNKTFKSPHEFLAASGSVEDVRQRNVVESMLTFFGM